MNFWRNANLEAFVFGFIYFKEDTEKTISLTDDQELKIRQEFENRLSTVNNQPIKWNTVSVAEDKDDAYHKIRLKKDDESRFKKFLGEDISDIIEEVQFGYYHHRAIFKFVFRSQSNFKQVRNSRSKIHELIRERCFDKFNEYTIPNTDITIRYIYSYTLFIVPNGQNLLNKEIKALKKAQYDPMFSIRTTAFGFPISGNKVVDSILGISHYVRISVPGTIVYLKGKRLDPVLLSYIIDGIYYGGLYKKIQMDRDKELKNGVKLDPQNEWPQDLMIETYKVLKDTVSVQALSYVSSTTDRLALIVAIAAIVIPLVSLIPNFKNEKPSQPQPTSNTTTSIRP